jgi:hypothetical protein
MRHRPMRDGIALSAALASALVIAGCSATVGSDCQTLAAIQGGYIVRFTRSGDAAAGCETQTPSEMGDVWVFDTLADSEIRAHSVSMPYPDPPPDTLPPNLIGAGKFTTREVDSNDRCRVESLTTMSDDSSGTLLSYAVSNMEWLGGPAYQGAEFQTDVLVTVGSCSAPYKAQALSPAVGCDTDVDCDPFKQPFSSGIASGLDQGCTSASWTAAVTAYLASSTGVSSTGVCFLRQSFPSLKPGAPAIAGSSPGG